MKNILLRTAIAAIALFAASGCAIQGIYDQQRSIERAARTQVNTEQKARPVVAIHEGSWLLGERIDASKPQPALYDKRVQFTPMNGKTATLAEIADFITTATNVPAVIDSSVFASANTGANTLSAPAAPPSTGAVSSTLPSPAMGITALPSLETSSGSDSSFTNNRSVPFPTFRGDFKGFLAVTDTRFGVWSRYRDGKVTFLRTETRTFSLPVISDSQEMTGSISTGDAGGGSGSVGSGAMGSSGAVGSSGSNNTGGQTISLKAKVNPWQSMEKTAKAIAGADATVVADPDLQMLTVSGTPPACDRIEQFVKDLTSQYGKRIAIDVRLYQIQETEEHNYGGNLLLAYQSASGHTGFSLSGASAPTISNSTEAMTVGATIMSGSLKGSRGVVQALSTLGKVTEVVTRSGVTTSHKVLGLQSATLQTYVASTQTTQTASVGSSSTVQTASVMPGFTSSFMPTYAGGKIQLNFSMTLSGPVILTNYSPGADASSVQLLTMPTMSLQQTTSLTPGETLILTGMRKQDVTTTNSGVGTPYTPLLGGGVDAQRQNTVIAVVITARLI